MDFGVESLRVTAGRASVALASLTTEEILAAKKELDAVGVERGLWVPAGAGSLAVATELDATPVETKPDLREQLLSTVIEGAALYSGVIKGINEGRGRTQRIPVLKPEQYAEMAADWLNGERLASSAQLPVTADRPLLLIPRLNRPVNKEEIVDAWKAAAGGQLWSWSVRMKFLSNWTPDQLSGFDPALADQTPFEVVPTAYDSQREGTVEAQNEALQPLKAQHPSIAIATIFNGIPLARRYMKQPRQWQDSYVRAIDLEPASVDGADRVPYAVVYDSGDAYVRESDVRSNFAARLLAR